MSDLIPTVLVAEPDARLRSLLVHHLGPLGYTVIQAANGETAFRQLTEQPATVVLCELYLATDAHADLIQAIRGDKAMRKTRVIAHTRRASARDREWATDAGADAFLIYPTRAERLRYVVSRLVSEKGGGSRPIAVTRSPIVRRRSLDEALKEQELGALPGLSTIVVGKDWWTDLARSSQSSYRKRAKKAGVTLRSDALLGSTYVVVRDASRQEQAALTQSPYKERPARA